MARNAPLHNVRSGQRVSPLTAAPTSAPTTTLTLRESQGRSPMLFLRPRFTTERQFRRIIGYHDLAKLAEAIEGDVAHNTPVGSLAEEAGAAQRRAPVFPFAPVEAG